MNLLSSPKLLQSLSLSPLLTYLIVLLVQTTSQPDRFYMNGQETLNSMMRAILVDWIVEVHQKFHLVPETLYLTVNIIDRYLSMVVVERKLLQLVGVTALLLACKYEEIYPPEVKDCVYITDKAYGREQVLEMEAKMVKTLKFHLTVPTGFNFLTRFLNITSASETVKNLAYYYSERMLQEYDSLKFRPSVLAAAAVTLALNNPNAVEIDNRRLSPSDRGVVSRRMTDPIF